jgi:Polysaccharide lyase/Ricin-type beta-trefoil lectin domain
MADSRIVGGQGLRHRRRAALVAALGAIALLVGVLATGVGPGRADAAVVTGRIGGYAGGCLENANDAATANNPLQLNYCGTNAGQLWSRYSDGTLRVQGGCADLLGGATTAGTRVVFAPCAPTSTSQRWTIYSSGFVQNQKSGTCLAPLNNQVYARVVVTIAVCANLNAQKWAVPAVSTTTPTTTTPPPTTTTRPTTTTPKPTTTTPRPTTTTPPPTTTTRPTTTTPPPTTTTPPNQTSQVWNSDFTGSGFDNFDDTPWNDVGASAPTIISSPVTAGAKAALFTMPARGTRSEIVPTTPEFTEGQDRWFRFSFYLPTSFPTQVTSWQVITQWKNEGDGSPPLEITVGGGNLKLEGGYGYPGGSRQFAQVLAPATTGARTDLILHVFFSRTPGKGSVDVWRNGAQVLSGYKPAGGTLYPTSTASTASLASYWKMGIYRDAAITQPAQYTIESAKIGNTQGQVAN